MTECSKCECHHKETPRSAAFQADLKKRLNRAIGQLNGVKDMLDDNRSSRRPKAPSTTSRR